MPYFNWDDWQPEKSMPLEPPPTTPKLTERQAIIRAQRHGWGVSTVTDDVILMKMWSRLGQRLEIFVWPDGKVSS